MTVFETREYYKPFDYDWAYEAYKKQNQIHWLPDEVSLGEDVKDWNNRLTDNERHLLTQIFRFFTQADIDVAGAYNDIYLPRFKKPELRQMMNAFAGMEAVHIDAYSHLIDTIGMPEIEYKAFFEYEEMLEKHDYLKKYHGNTTQDMMLSLAVFSAFTEGMQLFSSFAILLNFQRFGKMKGMGQIVTWSIRDESLHVESMLKLFDTLKQEFPYLWTEDLQANICDISSNMVMLEDGFIDLAFAMGDLEGLTSKQTKEYIRYIADRRLVQLGLPRQFFVDKNPLPWLDWVVNGPEHTNFFENRSTAYSKATTTGTWGECKW